MNKIKIWNRLHSILMLLALTGVITSRQPKILIVVVIVSITLLIYQHRTETFLWSYANIVTLFRLGMILWAGWHITVYQEWMSLLLLGIALTLDGVDGYLARKYKQSSTFGAYLDMETDSFFVAFLSVFWWLTGVAGFWLVIIGFLRYFYVLANYLLRLHHLPEKSTRFAKTIAVVFMMGMLSPLVLPPAYAYWILVLISGLTAYSFGVSFFYRYRIL